MRRRKNLRDLLIGGLQAAREISTKLTKGEEYLQDGLRLESEIALAEGNLSLPCRRPPQP